MTKSLNQLIAQSHRQQFEGEDYQAAAIGIADENGIAYESDAYTSLMSNPSPDCTCTFCRTAPFED